MSKRVLITGATGLIGRNTASVLHERNALLLSSSSKQRLPEGRTLPFDLSQVVDIPSWLDSLRPDVIVHTAAITSVDVAANDPHHAELINVFATQAIADWCGQNKARLIYFSTDFVFDGTRTDWKEEDPTHPLSWYGKTKVRSEEIVRNSIDDHVIIRPILVYGAASELGRLNFPLMVEAKLTKGEKLNITEDQLRMPTYVLDIALAVKTLINHSFCGTLHLAGPELLNVMEFALKSAEVIGLPTDLLNPVKTEDMHFSGTRPKVSGFDTSLARSVLNWKPMGVEEGLMHMHAQGRR